MKAAVHVVPCAGVLRAARESGPASGSGLAQAALRTAERLEEAADLVIIAVPAGHGQAVADRLGASNRPVERRPAARYISERGLTDEELDDLAGPGMGAGLPTNRGPR